MVKIDAIANTKAGKLQGVQIDGIYRFLGVRYAQSTEGKNRFMPPQPLIPWDGVKPALTYAAKCWQCDTPRMEDPEIRSTCYPSAYEKLMTGSNEMGGGFQSEDCLAVNIWTQGLTTAKAPCSGGSTDMEILLGQRKPTGMTASNIAKKEDVVLVTVGRRLGIFGYLYLCDLDEIHDSANVGHQDMAAALKWIRIILRSSAWDPDNVTCSTVRSGGRLLPLCQCQYAEHGTCHYPVRRFPRGHSGRSNCVHITATGFSGY